MICSFADKETKKIWEQNYSKKLPSDIQRMALRKLLMLHSAVNLNDLLIPPGNRLEKLSGNREGQYSIRINKQWRICFYWSEDAATYVEITDYH